MPKGKRLDLSGDGLAITGALLEGAIDHEARSDRAHPLEERLGRRRDARLRLSVLGYLVALNINCSRQGHKGCVLHVVQVLNGLGPATLRRLGMPDWQSLGSYDRVHRLQKNIAHALDQGWEHADVRTGQAVRCDWSWFKNRGMRAAIPDDVMALMVGNVALAVDGTEVESCGQFHGRPSSIELDGEVGRPDEFETATTPARKRKRRVPVPSVQVLGIGDDGRRIYTTDHDARAGWRTGNANHDGGEYIGREAHLGVAVPALVDTDGVTYAKFGPNVPPVILTADLVPAGTHRAKAVVPSIIDAHEAGLCQDLVVDPGYSLSSSEHFHLPLKEAGISVAMQPVNHQRGEKPGLGAARQIDGHLFAEQLPEELVNLSSPPRGASNEEKAPYIRDFEQRAAYRYRRIKAPGNDGTTRWRHPVNAGSLRSRQVRPSMRRTRVPLVNIDPGAQLSTVTASADTLAMWQPCLFGTTAWWATIGRRQLVESTNSLLHGAVGSRTDISRKYTKLRDSGRIKLFFYMTVSCYNRWVIRRWKQDHSFDPSNPDGATLRPLRRAPRRGRVKRFEDLPRPPDAPRIAA